MEKSVAYLFFGAPGSAKSTQSRCLKEDLIRNGHNVHIFNTGGSIRDLTKGRDSFLQRKIKNGLEEGLLLPSAIPISLWANAFIKFQSRGVKWICDGVARKPVEAGIFLKLCEFSEVDHVVAIFIDIPSEEIINRLKGRGRDDDDENTIAYRVKQYEEETRDSIRFMKEYGEYVTFLNIDGVGSVEEVHQRILEKTKSFI